jgi:hypothetical protein
MEALGREFNPVAVADDVYVNLQDAGGVTFLGYLASTGDVFTITEAKTAGGSGAQVLATVERFHTSNGVGGAWALSTQAAGSTVTKSAAAAQSAVVIEIEAPELSDTYKFVKCTSTGAGTVVAIVRDLHVQRKPANLASVIV